MFTRVLPASFSLHALRRPQVKLVRYPRFSNTLSETLRKYTFLVIIFIFGEIKSIMLKAWKIKSCNEILGVVRPPRGSYFR